ncbi:MAG: hypothetical protein AB1523_08040 [Bacillota bacterium]
MKFILEQSEEHITTHAGLSLVGLLVSKTSLKERSTKPVCREYLIQKFPTAI